MISITTPGQWQATVKLKTGWIKQAIHFIGQLLSFEEIRTIENRKQMELHESGLDILKMM